MKAIIQNDTILLSFAYNPDMVASVKGIPGRRWNPDAKVWSVPNTTESHDAIKALGFALNATASPVLAPTAPVTKSVPRCRRHGEKLILTFPYDPNLVGWVKGISGRRWDPMLKEWSVPCSIEAVRTLKQIGFDVPEDAEQATKVERIVTTQTLEAIEGLKMPLYPFQRESVKFLESHNGRAILGHEMGLGKSIISLAYLQLHPEIRPAIVICPATLKGNWERECRKWTNRTPTIISGKPKSDVFPVLNPDLIIINYDIVADWILLLRSINPQIVLCDETHLIKNHKASRTQAVLTLCKDIPHVIAISGTPIVNRPIEFFTPLNLVAPQVFPAFWPFAVKYCGATKTRYGWDMKGATNTNELHALLTSTCMIRQTKTEVLKDLPAKTHSVIPVEFSNEQYTEAIDKAKKRAQHEGRNLNVTEFLFSLKAIVAAAKVNQVVEWVQDWIEESDGKLVVFCAYEKTVDALMDKFGSIAIRMDGRDPQPKRQGLVDLFQTRPDIRLFVTNHKVGGVGITLTAASNVAFAETPWTPGETDQCSDRVLRIGQTADKVMAYYLVAQGTLEEDLIDLIDEKRKVLTQILDGQEVQESNMLKQLFNKIMAKRKELA